MTPPNLNFETPERVDDSLRQEGLEQKMRESESFRQWVEYLRWIGAKIE